MAAKKKAKTKSKTTKRKAIKKTGVGAKLARTEVVQIRLDPRLKFTAELSARRQRRTLSSFIEWAVQEAVSQVVLDYQTKEKISAVVEKVWDVDGADRFVKLASKYPDLLTFEEEKLWKAICTLPLWVLESDEKRGLDIKSEPEKFNLVVLRRAFGDYKAFAKGEYPETEFIDLIHSYVSDHEYFLGRS